MKDLLYSLLILAIVVSCASLISSFHQTAREEQLQRQGEQLAEYKIMMSLAQHDPEGFQRYCREKFGEEEYCICVPWSEKMIKKMGKDVYHGTKRVYQSVGGL